MESFIIVVHVVAAIAITGLVLIQHGKGADAGASFGGGASQTMFGSVGTGNALTKSTTWLAVIFFVTSLTLALFAKQQAGQGIQDDSLIENTGILGELIAPPAVQNSPASEDVPVVPDAQTSTDIPVVEGDVPEAPATDTNGEQAGNAEAATDDAAVDSPDAGN